MYLEAFGACGDRLALFELDAVAAAAIGRWVHVYVDRSTRRPVPIPEAIRSLMETARVE